METKKLRGPHTLQPDESIVLKAVLAGGYSGSLARTKDRDNDHNRFKWNLSIGYYTHCNDFIPNGACGNGLHGWLEANGDPEAISTSVLKDRNTLWLALAVKSKDIDQVSIGKVKFPSARLLYKGTKSKTLAYIRSVINKPTMFQNLGTLDQFSVNNLPASSTAIIKPGTLFKIPYYADITAKFLVNNVITKTIVPSYHFIKDPEPGTFYLFDNHGTLLIYDLFKQLEARGLDLKPYDDSTPYINQLMDVPIKTRYIRFAQSNMTFKCIK